MGEYWYAIEVEDSEMELNCKELQEQGIQIFLPFMEKLLRKQGVFNLVCVPEFANYIFVKTNNISVQGHLKNCYKRIYHLSTCEQDLLNKLMDDSYIIRQSTGLIKDGETIALEGPLKGLEKEIKRIDRHKRLAYMRQEILGMQLKVGLEITTKI